MIAIRGAITVNKNERKDILEATRELLQTVIDENKLNLDKIISITFTATKDLDAVYPAVAARDLGIVDAALLCHQELYVKGSLHQCVRILLHYDANLKQSDAKHVYLKGATVLRPDLSETIS